MSFCITVRPLDGLHGDYDDAIMKFIQKQNYGVYVHEMEDEARHLHAQIWLTTDREQHKIDNIRKALFRIGQKYDPNWSPAAKKVLSKGVKYAYSNYFVEKYMTKDNTIEYDCRPENPDDYYPSLEEQEEAKKKATRVADAYFDHLAREWNEHYPDYEFNFHTTIFDVAKFYYDLMFKEKKIAVIRDDKARKQNAKCLLHYLFPHQQSIMELVMTKEDREQYLLFKDSQI